MKNKPVNWLALSLILLFAASVVLSQRTTIYDELPNFHQVNEKLYRGAQPKKDGIKRLAQLGVKTIVNLREEDGLSRSEAAEARAAGLRYFNIPLKRAGRPTDQQVESAL